MAILPPDPLFCLKSDMDHIHNLCFLSGESSTTNLLASTESGFVYFWDLQTNRVRHKQNVGKSVLALHSIDNNLITQEKSGLVKIWNYRDESNYDFVKDYQCNGGYCRSILVDKMLIVPQANSTLDVVELKSFECIRTFKPSDQNLGYVMCLQQVEIGGNLYILAGFETGDIILWDFVTAKLCSQLKLREYITSLTFDSHIRRGVCGNSSNVLQVFTIDPDLNVRLKCDLTITNDGCSVVKLRPDRKIFVSGGWDGRIRIFSWKSLRQLAVLNEHQKSVTDVQFSPNVVTSWRSHIIAAGSADGIISLWNLYN